MAQDQKRALLAVVLSGLILFGWQYFFAPPQTYDVKQTDSTINENKDSKNISSNVRNGSEEKVVKAVAVEEIILENELNSYVINSQLTVVSGVYKETGSKFDEIFTAKNNSVLFLLDSEYKSVDFRFTNVAKDRAEFTSGVGLSGIVFVNDKGFVEYSISSSKPFGYKFRFKESIDDDSTGSLMAMGGAVTKQFGYYSDEFNTLGLESDEKGEASLKYANVENDYHLFANVFKDKKLLVYKTNEAGSFVLRGPEKTLSLDYKQIFVRKEYDHLGALGHNLQQSIDFGIWAVIAVPILRGLQFFYSIFPNYGISIILLTIIIRMLTFPLQYKSFKSMKKMQEIQPDLTKLREKYKDNPQKMQQETMALFKRAGANPLGGCLPMLLQMPVFFAFYRVLYSSVELVDAPFYFWIYDLSEKDPYYVLPILMGLAMVLNQKLMPSTVSDPMQKKVMLFMPLIFAIFMKDFPAGLTLYIVVSTIMGMAQQLYVYKRA